MRDAFPQAARRQDPLTRGSLLVIGAGNAYRRDDGAGLAVARRLQALLTDVRVLVKTGDCLSLLDEWDGIDAVIVIDATMSGARPGTIRRHEATNEPLPAGFSRSSTHTLGIHEAIELARALRRLPRRIVVFGIEGGDFTAGEGLSPEVDAAVDEVVALVSTADDFQTTECFRSPQKVSRG
jgi:hydrogenase maturation protease